MLQRLKAFAKSQTFHIFLIFLAICFVAYVGYLNQNYIGDNYGGRVDAYDQMSIGEFFNNHIVTDNGRHMSITYWLLHAPLSKIGITYHQNQWVFFAIEIIVMAIASTIFYKVFAKTLKCKKLSLPLLLVTSFIAVNPFICDSLIYLLPSHPQALLFVAISLYFLTKNTRLKSILLSLLFLTLAVSTYQNYYALFAILALPLIFIENKGKLDKTLAKRTAIALGIMAVSIGIVLVVSKLHCAILGVNASKNTTIHLSISWLTSRAIWLAKSYLKTVKTNFYLFPPMLLVAIIASALIAIGTILIKKHKIKELIYVIIILAFGFMSPIYYGIIADTFYLAPRILPAIFACLSISIILLMYYAPKIINNQLFVGGTVAITAIIVYCCSTFITDVMICNRIELAEMRVIMDAIERYEAENNTTVNTIAVYHVVGAKNEMLKSNIHMKAAENASRDIATTGWSDVSSISTMSGRDFERKDMTEEQYKELFSDITMEDFRQFNPERRLRIKNNTLYWAEY